MNRMEAFEIRPSSLIINTHDYPEEYNALTNKTFLITIQAKNDFSFLKDPSLSFEVKFTDMRDMNVYRIASLNETIFLHAYGDISFERVIDYFYSGPNKEFGIKPKTNLELRPENKFETKNYLNSIIRELQEDSNCTKSVFSRWKHPKTGKESVSFFCIGTNIIEKHEFDAIDMVQIDFRRDIFPFANFIDFYVHENENTRGRRLRILSHEHSEEWYPAYYIHEFLFTRNMLRWRRRTKIQIDGYTLREFNPLIDIDFGYGFNALVDASERNVIFTTIRFKRQKAIVKSNNRVRDVHPCCGMNIYFSHYGKNYVSSYRFFYYFDQAEDSIEARLEFVKYIRFYDVYKAFDVDKEGRAVLFSKDNQIDLMQAFSQYDFDFVRRFPMYSFKNKVRFVICEQSGIPLFQMLENSLYVLMYDQDNPSDKKIFIYKMDTPSHNSLLNLIDLDSKFTDYPLSLSSEIIRGFDTVIIYLFFDGRIYQYIEYQKENTIVPKWRD